MDPDAIHHPIIQFLKINLFWWSHNSFRCKLDFVFEKRFWYIWALIWAENKNLQIFTCVCWKGARCALSRALTTCGGGFSTLHCKNKFMGAVILINYCFPCYPPRILFLSNCTLYFMIVFFRILAYSILKLKLHFFVCWFLPQLMNLRFKLSFKLISFTSHNTFDQVYFSSMICKIYSAFVTRVAHLDFNSGEKTWKTN